MIILHVVWIKFSYVGGENVDIRVKHLNLVQVNYLYPNTINIHVIDKMIYTNFLSFLNTIVDMNFSTTN